MTTFRNLMTASVLFAAFATPKAFAAQVTYNDASWTPSATLGSTTLTCPQQDSCIVISITFVADTANIQPFSVPGASGFENFVGQGSLSLFDSETNQTLKANFLDNQIYVSVDQTNGGVGFGTPTGVPTYPLATYGGNPSIPDSSYDLASNFFVVGWSWFCPTPGPNNCATDVATDKGAFSLVPVGPVASAFSATVEATLIPEPASLMMAAAGLLALTLGFKPRGRKA